MHSDDHEIPAECRRNSQKLRISVPDLPSFGYKQAGRSVSGSPGRMWVVWSRLTAWGLAEKGIDMNYSFNSRVTVAPDVLSLAVGDETVLLNVKTELYLGIDQVGTRMWTLLATSPSIQDAYETLLQEYNVEPARLRNDLSDFLGRLWLQSLIQFDLAVPVAEEELTTADAVFA